MNLVVSIFFYFLFPGLIQTLFFAFLRNTDRINDSLTPLIDNRCFFGQRFGGRHSADDVVNHQGPDVPNINRSP